MKDPTKDPARLVIKTFSSTMAKDRDTLGDRATSWLREKSHLTVVEIRTLQSSDDEFHCTTIIIIAAEL